jgi:hypothetical protein
VVSVEGSQASQQLLRQLLVLAAYPKYTAEWTAVRATCLRATFGIGAVICPKKSRRFTHAEGAEGHYEGMAPIGFWTAGFDWLDTTTVRVCVEVDATPRPIPSRSPRIKGSDPEFWKVTTVARPDDHHTHARARARFDPRRRPGNVKGRERNRLRNILRKFGPRRVRA